MKNDCFHERNKTEMCIESVDAVASYSKNKQNLKFAVSILNLCGEPICRSEVGLVVNAPDGSKFSLSRLTDSQGVALFELQGIDRGRWEAIVFKVQHPVYNMSSSQHNRRWSITYV